MCPAIEQEPTVGWRPVAHDHDRQSQGRQRAAHGGNRHHQRYNAIDGRLEMMRQ